MNTLKTVDRATDIKPLEQKKKLLTRDIQRLSERLKELEYSIKQVDDKLAFMGNNQPSEIENLLQNREGLVGCKESVRGQISEATAKLDDVKKRIANVKTLGLKTTTSKFAKSGLRSVGGSIIGTVKSGINAADPLAKCFNLYAQAERNPGIVPNRQQLDFAQRYVYKGLYKKETWVQYCQRLGIGD